jgi:hypothetical protein
MHSTGPALHMFSLVSFAPTQLLASWPSFMMEYDIHTVLDFLTLGATAWVVYTLRMPLKDTYQVEQDSVQSYYVVRFTPLICP